MASGNAAAERVVAERDVPSVPSYGEGHGQPRALAGEAVADDPVDRRVDRAALIGLLEGGPDLAVGQRTEAGGQHPEARTQPGVHPGRDAAVDSLGDA